MASLGITDRLDFDGEHGPARHPDLKDLGSGGRIAFWLRQGAVEGPAAHVGFLAASEAHLDEAYAAAIVVSATDNGAPGARVYFDPRYYAANVLDSDGYSPEFVFKSWQQ